MANEVEGGPVRVVAAMSPATYRVYPHTPLAEVAELMVRRELRWVPVVGEEFELLGMVSSREVLQALFARTAGAPPATAETPGTASGGGDTPADAPEDVGESRDARSIMSRSVMCVSEDDDLADTATAMAARDVEVMGVVRDAELVGLLSREAVLAALLNPGGSSSV